MRLSAASTASFSTGQLCTEIHIPAMTELVLVRHCLEQALCGRRRFAFASWQSRNPLVSAIACILSNAGWLLRTSRLLF